MTQRDFICIACMEDLKTVLFFSTGMKYLSLVCTHIDFAQDDINNATNNNNEVKDVPGVSKVTLHREAKHTDTLGSETGWTSI